MSGKTAKVKCTEKRLKVLEQIINSSRSEVRLVARSEKASARFTLDSYGLSANAARR